MKTTKSKKQFLPAGCHILPPHHGTRTPAGILSHAISKIKIIIEADVKVVTILDCACGWSTVTSDVDSARTFFERHAKKCSAIGN